MGPLLDVVLTDSVFSVKCRVKPSLQSNEASKMAMVEHKCVEAALGHPDGYRVPAGEKEDEWKLRECQHC